ITDENEYLNLFKNTENKSAIGESSPTYLWDKEAPGLIRSHSPNARIIILLRDPIERAYSHYLHHVRDGWETLPFYEALQRDYNKREQVWKVPDLYIDQGLYYQQVKRYLDVFGGDKVHISIFEEFVKEPERTVRTVLDFLGIDAEVPNNTGSVYNPFYQPRTGFSAKLHRFLSRSANSSKTMYKLTHIIPIEVTTKIAFSILFKSGRKPQIPDEAKAFLSEIYKDDVTRLESLLTFHLPWKH
ncbi:MAG: sulfotransferase family protein, partial [Nitrososphaera sp.]